MIIKAIQCPFCEDIIYSRARHDFRHCGCGTIFVDGGFDCQRAGWIDIPPKPVEIDIDVTQKELYDDWNLAIDKHGLIPKGE